MAMRARGRMAELRWGGRVQAESYLTLQRGGCPGFAIHCQPTCHPERSVSGAKDPSKGKALVTGYDPLHGGFPSERSFAPLG